MQHTQPSKKHIKAPNQRFHRFHICSGNCNPSPHWEAFEPPPLARADPFMGSMAHARVGAEGESTSGAPFPRLLPRRRHLTQQGRPCAG